MGFVSLKKDGGGKREVSLAVQQKRLKTNEVGGKGRRRGEV